MGYYDLAREARVEVANSTGEVRKSWKERLEDLGVRVGNALVEMGDLDGAARHLESLRLGRSSTDGDEMLRQRIALLYLRIGDVAAAKRFIGEGESGSTMDLLQPLLSMAEGRYEDAVHGWKALREAPSTSCPEMVTQNLAVCLLYTGKPTEVSPPPAPVVHLNAYTSMTGAVTVREVGRRRVFLPRPDLQPLDHVRTLH